MLANKFDGDCFALVGAHQHGITIHNQDLMRERESGVISFIIYYYGGGGGGGENYAWGEVTKLFFIYFLSAVISELSTMLQISPCSM